MWVMRACPLPSTVKRVDEVVRHPHLVTQDQFTQVSKKVSNIPVENFSINIELFWQNFSNVELLRQKWIVWKVTSPGREPMSSDLHSSTLPLRHTFFLIQENTEGYKAQLLPSSQTGRSPAPTLPWGQWASLRYTSFAGGRGSYGFQEHICDVNSSACRAYVSSFYTFRVYLLPTATFSRSFSCTFSNIHAYIHLWTDGYIFAAIFVYIFVHTRLHSSVDA